MPKKSTGAIFYRPKRTLVMLSGGIDSTAALWRILHRPDEYGQVHTHHIHMQNVEVRWQAEAEAVKAILAYMRHHAPTPFTASESTINTPTFGNKFLFDTEVINFITGYMTSRDPLIDRVVIGGTATDFAMGANQAISRGRAIHNAFHPDESDNSTKIKRYPLAKLTKAEVYNTLPPDLAILTWSCRTPKYIDGKPVECGRCKTCLLELRDVKRLASPGKKANA
jgi:7-cyano-7-deazaguanine synthase in queuosine biosynthesis